MTNTTKMSKAEERRKELETVLQKLDIATDNLQAASTQLRELEARKQSGDVTLQAKDIAEAEASVKHWREVTAAVSAQVKLAERRLVPDTPELAEAVAFNIGTAFYGVQAEGVESVDTYSEGDARRVLITQRGMHTVSNGSLSGEIEIVVLADSYTQLLAAKDVEKALGAAGITWRAADLDYAQPGRRFRVQVRNVYPELPLIEHPRQGESEDTFGLSLASSIEKASYLHSFDAQALRAFNELAVIESTEIEDDLRATTTLVKLQVVPAVNAYRESWRTGPEAVQAGTKALSDIKGKVLRGVGRVSDVELLDPRAVASNQYGQPITEVSARVIAKSRVA